MKLRMSLILVLILAVMTVPRMASAAELTMDDCIELALQNRASIIAAIGAEKAASSQKRAALGAFMPRLNAEYSYYKSKDSDIKFEQDASPITGLDTFAVQGMWSSGEIDSIGLEYPVYGPSEVTQFESPDQDRTSKTLSFSARMSLFEPSNWFNYSAAKASHASAKLNVLASEQDLIYSVKVAFFAYLATMENVTVQEEAVKRADEQLKLAESRFELGSASRSDVLKQKVQYGNDRLSLLSSRNDANNSRASLAYTIGVDPRENWEFSPEYSSREYGGTLEEAIAFGLEHKPDLLSATKQVDAAKNYVRSAKMGYLPTLSGFASLSYSDGTRGDTVAFDQSSTSKSFGFTVSYNLFDGFFRESQITSYKVALNDRRAELVDTRNYTVNVIKAAYSDIERLREQVKVSEENVNAADEDLKISQEKYRLGAATILDLLDAQVSLKEAQMSLIQSEFDLNLAIANLENAMGIM